jgi:ABC-type polysaccharide/polyol phosphate transport system ATPase subunit
MWMQSDTVLEVEGLSKLYSRIQGATRKRLANTFTRTLWGRSPRKDYVLTKGEFWSLKDVSFSLKRGEALGVIGLNGAGKTTLLRLLAGQILPDQGEIRILGRAAAMIDLTAGFQMSASGQRNIYLRGAMLGRSREEIAATYDEIVDFAELGDAINAPVSTYSSGMLMRLAFSIMVATRPDVLFIDEILSVGDFRFRQKCLGKIKQLREKSAFVLVSHSMGDVKNFCDSVLVLGRGEVLFQGSSEHAVEFYLKEIECPGIEQASTERVLGEQFSNSKEVLQVSHWWQDSSGERISRVEYGSSLYLHIYFQLSYAPKKLIVGIPLWDSDGNYVTGFTTNLSKHKIKIPKRTTSFSLTLSIPTVYFNPGGYISNVTILDGVEYLYRKRNHDIEVFSKNLENYWGVVTFDYDFLVEGGYLEGN